MFPKPQLILEYSHFFGKNINENRLDLIKGISKKHILFEIAGLNYRLKPNNQLKYDTSWETQLKELTYFCPIDPQLLNYYISVSLRHFNIKGDHPIIFNRAGNLFAMEEILNNAELFDIEGFVMRKVEVWDAIFKYLLAINSEITKVKEIKEDNLTLETISASTIVLNELMIEENPLLIPYKGLRLMEFLSSHPVYGKEIDTFFNNILKIEKDRFIYNVYALIIANKHKDKSLEFAYVTENGDSFLDYLSSNRIKSPKTINLLSLKKAPFYKDSHERYIVLDNNFLFNKSYNFFINDFWFDYLKPQKDINGNEKFNIKDYRGAFGLFFEMYVEEIIRNSFIHFVDPKPLLFDDLKISISKSEIEIADIYIRQNNKILVGQVKSNSIYDNEKYGGDTNKLYRNDREKFFSDFGVNQVVDSITNIIKYFNEFDANLPIDKELEFYPTIIVNEKVFQTPLIPNLFHIRFQELITGINFGKHKINPLSIIHISDLEYLEFWLSTKEKNIWNILDYHLTDASLMPPFCCTIDTQIDRFVVMERVSESVKVLINKYSKK